VPALDKPRRTPDKSCDQLSAPATPKNQGVTAAAYSQDGAGIYRTFPAIRSWPSDSLHYASAKAVQIGMTAQNLQI